MAGGRRLLGRIMFVGHFGIGFGATAVAPRVSLGTLFFAAQFVDLLWPTLLLLGVERVAIQPGVTAVTPLDFLYYPISHSLLAVVCWAFVLGAVYYVTRRYRRGAVVVGLAVLSHWLLDALTHRPDLPLYPGGDWRIGLGLWSSVAATLAVELFLFAVGIWLYLRTTRALDRAGTVGLWSLVIFLILIYAGNIFGDPPPSVGALAWVAQAQWLLVLWGYWVDRHRQTLHRSLPERGSEAGSGGEGVYLR